MNFRTTLILAVLAVVAAGTVLLIRYKMPADEQGGRRETLASMRAFAGVSASDVTRIEVDRQGKLGRIVLEQSDHNWRLVEPVAAKARYTQASLLARLLAELTYDRTAKVGSPALDSARLDPPEATIRFTTKVAPKNAAEGAEPTVATYELAVGRQTGLGTDRYTFVRVKGSDVVYLAKGELHEVATADLEEFRDKNLFDFGPGRIGRLALSHNGTTFAAERADADTWTLVEPIRARGDAEAIDALLSTATSLVADDFVEIGADDGSRYGFDKPRLTLVMQEKAAAKNESSAVGGDSGQAKADEPVADPAKAPAPVVHTLIIGGQADLQGTKAYARVEGQPSGFVIQEKSVRALRKEVFDLRDRRAVPMESQKVDHLALDLDGTAVALDRADAAWTIVTPEKAPAEGQSVQSLLDKIAAMKVTAFADKADPASAELGLDKPYGTITFRHRGDVKDTSIVIGREVAGGAMWVFDPSTSVAGKVDGADVLRLKTTWLDLHQLSVWTIGPELVVRSASWTRNGETVELTNSGTNEKPQWRLVQPIEAAPIVEKVHELMGHLRNVEASRNLAAVDKAADFGLDDPAIRVAVKAEAAGGQTREFTLLIAERDSKHVGMVADGKLIFEVDPALVNGLTVPLDDAAWADFNKDQVTRLEIRGPNVELNLNRLGDEWTADKADGLNVNSMRVRWLLSDLAEIQPTAIVRYKTDNLLPYHLDQPEWRIRVKGLTFDRTFLVGGNGPGGRYATVEGSGRVVILDLKDVEKLAKDRSYYEAAR